MVVSSETPLISIGRYQQLRCGAIGFELTLEILGIFGVNELGQIASIIEDQVKGLSAGECSELLLNAPGVLLLGFAFPRVDRNTGGCDAGRNKLFSIVM